MLIKEQADDGPQHEYSNLYSETEYDKLCIVEVKICNFIKWKFAYPLVQFTVEASPPGLYTPLEYYLCIHYILPQVNKVLMHHNLWAQYKLCKIFLPFFEDLPPGCWFYQDGATPLDIAVIYGLVVPFIQLWGKSGEMWIISGCQ